MGERDPAAPADSADAASSFLPPQVSFCTRCPTNTALLMCLAGPPIQDEFGAPCHYLEANARAPALFLADSLG